MRLACRSNDWYCPECGKAMRDILPALTAASAAQSAEARELATQIAFKVSRVLSTFDSPL